MSAWRSPSARSDRQKLHEHALAANLCFTLAYLLEFLFRDTRLARRWSLVARPVTLALGTLIAMGAAFNAADFIGMVQSPLG